MHDQYAPEPQQALCPHCGATAHGAPIPTPALRLAVLTWQCAACHSEWDELRKPTAILRYWTPGAAALPATSG